ncbi:ribbon-helix-helix domain-containing protein [Candidatus Bathyarchaeota archaeon]|nr:ribbon-helix-helix domain-containing protein [Candidatus Bathyarchaeota archaeon]
MKKSKELKTTSLGRVRVSAELVKNLDEYCKKRGIKNKSDVVRLAIARFICSKIKITLLRVDCPKCKAQLVVPDPHSWSPTPEEIPIKCPVCETITLADTRKLEKS